MPRKSMDYARIKSRQQELETSRRLLAVRLREVQLHIENATGYYRILSIARPQDVVTERPDGKGGLAACDTWDNATLLCEARDAGGQAFPMTLKMQRIAPGEMNSWNLEVRGMKSCARFSTRNPQVLEVLEYTRGRQDWKQVMCGYSPAFPGITGGIFEFGFPDSILQMWAAFVHEVAHGAPLSRFAGTVTPQEAALSHALFTAALESQRTSATLPVRMEETR
jgi:predicted dehydrogenase